MPRRVHDDDLIHDAMAVEKYATLKITMSSLIYNLIFMATAEHALPERLTKNCARREPQSRMLAKDTPLRASGSHYLTSTSYQTSVNQSLHQL